jgi:protein-tyrosine-phosphatase
MAEALLRLIDSRNFDAFSAGITRQDVHPLSREVMKEIGIDLDHKVTRIVDDLRGETFDFIITLDEAAACHKGSPAAGEIVHWKFDNLVALPSDREAQRRVFRSVRDQIAQRLRLFAIVNVRPNVPPERTHVVAGRSNPVIQAS